MTADEYAEAILKIEHESALDVKEIENQLPRNMFGSDVALRGKDFVKFDVPLDADDWVTTQRSIIDPGTTSTFNLYRLQGGRIKLTKPTDVATVQIIYKPRTSVVGELQVLRTEKSLDANGVDRAKRYLERARDWAIALYEESKTAFTNDQFAKAAGARVKADFLATQYAKTLDHFTAEVGIDISAFPTEVTGRATLQAKTAEIYEAQFIRAAEGIFRDISVAETQVGHLIEQAETAYASSDFDNAAQLREIASLTHAKQEGQLRSVDRLAAEVASARNAGILKLGDITATQDWSRAGGAGPEAERPKFVKDAIDRAVTKRDSLYELNADGLLSEAQYLADLMKSTNASGLKDLASRAMKLLYDLRKLRDTVDVDRLGEKKPILAGKIRELDYGATELRTQMEGKGLTVHEEPDELVELSNEVATKAAANPEGFWAEALAKGGRVHTAVRGAGFVLMVWGASQDFKRIVKADDKLEVTTQVAGAWAGAWALSTGVVMAVTFISGPPGWIAEAAIGIVAGGVGYWLGDKGGKALYEQVRPHHDADDETVDISDLFGSEELHIPFDTSPFPNPNDYLARES